MQPDSNHKIIAELKEMQRIFEEPGWRIIVSHLHQSAEELKEAVLYSKDWGETQFLKGRVEQCRTVASLEDLVLNQLAAFEQDGDDHAADV